MFRKTPAARIVVDAGAAGGPAPPHPGTPVRDIPYRGAGPNRAWQWRDARPEIPEMPMLGTGAGALRGSLIRD